jgi:integrase
MKLPKSWPKVVAAGHSIVKIYYTPSNGSDQFTLVYYLGDKRIRKTYSDYGKAFTDAETTAAKLSEGELNVLELKGDARLALVRSEAMLKPTGVPLEMAVMRYVEMWKIVGDANPVEVGEFFKKFHPSNMPAKSVAEVVDELIEAKEADRCSDVYIKDLKGRLGKFKAAFAGRIGSVMTGDIENFLRNVKVMERVGGEVRYKAASPKSRNHYRAAIGTLFYFAEARGYIPKGLVDIEAVALAKQKDGEIEIFRPEEMARVLAAASDNLIPFLTIGAFAGLRHAEIQRLDWSEVRLEDGFIEVKAGKAKTASRRLVPITDNLRKWLLPHHKPQGPVCLYASMSKQLLWIAEDVDKAWKKENPPGSFVWKHNALRHSFISYRVADVKNAAQVALEAGNSPRMIFSNYRELVRPTDAKKWFSIEPKADDKVTPMPKPAESPAAVACLVGMELAEAWQGCRESVRVRCQANGLGIAPYDAGGFVFWCGAAGGADDSM